MFRLRYPLQRVSRRMLSNAVENSTVKADGAYYACCAWALAACGGGVGGGLYGLYSRHQQIDEKMKKGIHLGPREWTESSMGRVDSYFDSFMSHAATGLFLGLASLPAIVTSPLWAPFYVANKYEELKIREHNASLREKK